VDVESRYWGTELAGLDYWLQWLVASQQGHPVKTVLRHILLSQAGPDAVLHWTDVQSRTPGITYGWAYYTHSMLQQLLTRFSGGEFSAHPFPQLPLKSGAVRGDPPLPYSPVLAFVFRKGADSGFIMLNKDATPYDVELPSGKWQLTTLTAAPDTVGSQLAVDPRARTTAERRFDSAPYSVTIGVKAP
jgi:hypothetical protein